MFAAKRVLPIGLVDAGLAVHLQAYIKGYILHHLLLDFVVETGWSLPTLSPTVLIMCEHRTCNPRTALFKVLIRHEDLVEF